MRPDMTLQMTEDCSETGDSKAILPLVFRVIAFGLALGFWTYYVGRKPFDAHGGWRYLTNWGLSLNLLAAAWALGGTWLPGLKKNNPILPTALTVSSMVVILYWGLYFINPSMVNAKGGLPWYSEIYMHLGTTVIVYAEAFWLNPAPANRFRSLPLVSLTGLAYIVWADQVVARYNTAPCGLTTDVCGYPYPFLNDLSSTDRLGFYAIAWFAMLGLSSLIMALWSQNKADNAA